MSMSDVTLTFTWQGQQIPWVGDTDDWTMQELREVEAQSRTAVEQLSRMALHGMMMCVSIARATGQRIAEVDAAMMFSDIRPCVEELTAQRRENAEREAARLAAEAALVPTGRVVDFTGHGVIGAEGADGAQTSDGGVPFPGSEQEGGPTA